MADSRKYDNAIKIEDSELDEVSGGSLLSNYSDEEYLAAGVEILKPGFFKNGGYKLIASGEELGWLEARYAVRLFKELGRPAKNFKEIFNRYQKVFDNMSQFYL